MTGSRWHPAGCSSGPGWSHLACVGRAERGARSGPGPGAGAWPRGGGGGDARCPPRSRLRKPSSARMAATAEATSGSSLSCALNASIRSEREKGGASGPARPGPARLGPTPAPLRAPRYRRCSWPRSRPPPRSRGHDAAPLGVTSRRALTSFGSASQRRQRQRHERG